MHRLTATLQRSDAGRNLTKTLLGAKGVPAEVQLSNRQKFKQIQPSPKLYEKLEKLGFGSLLKTKRYASLNKEKDRRQKKELKWNDRAGSVDPHYNFPLLSFFAGAKVPTSFPPETLDEIAFVGRSNVGKSSLLNSLAETTVVRTSDKPGLTQQLNFFNVGKLFHMVDMPGYGFAFVDESEREKWRGLMETYIADRKTLKRVYVVLDARHGIKVADTEFLKMLESKRSKFQIVLTKCDLLVLPDLARRITMVEDNIKQYRYAVQNVIAVSSKSLGGINQLRKEMLFLMNHLKPREFYEAIEEQKQEKLQKKKKKERS
ncbi:P-loop containing nucleoside triphosphate hydrolase protein [Sporodiniella umbellata]|nr:P-loop containing nucleoside triphosphate hydrolase protein [Sporodiniella umbellata]